MPLNTPADAGKIADLAGQTIHCTERNVFKKTQKGFEDSMHVLIALTHNTDQRIEFYSKTSQLLHMQVGHSYEGPCPTFNNSGKQNFTF